MTRSRRMLERLLAPVAAVAGKAYVRAYTRYNRAIYEAVGGENRPVFFDIAKTAPALLEIDKRFPEIKDEVESLLKRDLTLPTYHELDSRQRYISGGTSKKWKVFVLYAMGAKPKANRALCPRTSALLDEIPHLFQAFFSILEAGKSVPEHAGPYRGYIRYHLGLIVPKDHPPKIRIKDQFHTWQEGSSVLFDDTWNHEVYNQSASDRVILLVDVMRPMPWYLQAVHLVYTRVIVRLTYTAGVLKNLEKFR